MNGLLGTLNIDLQAVVVNIIGFVLLLWVANSLVFKPIGKVIDEREQDVNSTYDKIEADRKQMEALKEDYEKRLSGIETEAREKIQNAIKEAQAARDQIVTEATERGRDLVSRAEREADRERQEAMITLRKQIVDLALGATTKILGDGLDESRQRQLIDDFITTGGGSAGPAAPITTAAAAEEAAKPRTTRRAPAKTNGDAPTAAADAPAATTPEVEA